ncbi:MAG: PEP-CTERM sorting domain-containing protein [Sedimentisphaerales bacterium]
MKMQKLLVVLGVLAMAVVPASAMLHEVTTTAGPLSGIGNDSTTPFDAYSWGYAAYDMGGDGDLDLLLDLGSVKNIDKILMQNRTDVSSNGAFVNLVISVADEAATGFNPTDISFYNTVVYNSYATPPSPDAGLWREADITNSAKRYFQIRILDTWWGAPSPTFIGDVDITEVPEPATMCILGLGGLLAIRRRKTA